MALRPRQPDDGDDCELVRRIGRGEDAAFEALYVRHRDWVVRLAERFTRNGDDALDVLQETFAYLLRRAPTLRLEVRLTTFLYPVVQNLARAAVVRRRRFAAPSDELPEPSAPAPPGASDVDLAAALEGLHPGQREVVLLRFVDDLSLDEIAAALAIPLGTVKSRLYLALGRLREDPRTRDHFAGG